MIPLPSAAAQVANVTRKIVKIKLCRIILCSCYGSTKVKNALNPNHLYRSFAKSVFYQLSLFVIVTGVLRNYLQ